MMESSIVLRDMRRKSILGRRNQLAFGGEYLADYCYREKLSH